MEKDIKNVKVDQDDKGQDPEASIPLLDNQQNNSDESKKAEDDTIETQNWPDHDSVSDSMSLDFHPAAPVNKTDLLHSVQFNLGEPTGSIKAQRWSKCQICWTCLGLTCSCLLFTLALMILFGFSAITYKAILAKQSIFNCPRPNLTNFIDEFCPSCNDTTINEDESDDNSDGVISGLTPTELQESVLERMKQFKLRDCNRILVEGKGAKVEDGVYQLSFHYGVSAVLALTARCDMTTFGGGWTVIQSRGQYDNDPDYFNRNFSEYQDGFGDEQGEYWIGLEVMQMLTSLQDQELLVQLWNEEDTTSVYARYNSFSISRDGKYRLEAFGYSGTAGDALSYSHGRPFSTPDRDQDHDDSRNCAEDLSGGWWFGDCARSNLNGLNVPMDELETPPAKTSHLKPQDLGTLFWLHESENCGARAKKTWSRVEMKIRPRRSSLHAIGLDLRTIQETETKLDAC